MTGYAAASGRRGSMAVFITVKSVNHRFLDLHLKLPPELEPLEAKIRKAVRERLTRGHVDLSIVLEREGGVDAHIDHALVVAYLDAYNRLRQEFGLTAEADLNTVLKVPGALSFVPAALGDEEAQAMEDLVLGTLGEALDRLDAMRAEEARSLSAELAGRLQTIRRAHDEIERLRNGAERAYMHKLRDRLTELASDAVSPERIAQEAAILADRSDVSEELMRLRSHLQQFQALLEAKDADLAAGEAGKRLDFLLQEMNRESNTILSKTSGLGDVGVRITTLGLSVKAEIEKLREQVQNLQ
jgi:uncharacterized protein (TIGR00255 family)